MHAYCLLSLTIPTDTAKCYSGPSMRTIYEESLTALPNLFADISLLELTYITIIQERYLVRWCG